MDPSSAILIGFELVRTVADPENISIALFVVGFDFVSESEVQ
jgi:hypothetical protein